ncbi:hypothetical protein ACT3RR_00425 [Ewingella sp. AOP8-B2-18]
MSDDIQSKRIDQLERVNRELLVQISAMRILFGVAGSVINQESENAFTIAVNETIDAGKAELANTPDLDDASKKFRGDVFKCAQSLLPGTKA